MIKMKDKICESNENLQVICRPFIAPLEKELIELKRKLEPEPLEDYWNNKRPKIYQEYLRHETDGDYQIDVRNFFQPYDEVIPKVTGEDFDDIARNALIWVMEHITYVPDNSNDTYKTNEYWAYAYQTMHHRKGDCEDGAILLANIMLRSGIPYWRIRLNAGSVNGGGHAYVTYLREFDNNWTVLDWCYWANYKRVAERPTHDQEQNYTNKNRNFYIWFSWNMKYSFGQMDTMKGMPKGLFNGKKKKLQKM